VTQTLVLQIGDEPPGNPGEILLTAGLVVAAVGLVGALSLPWVGRVMRPEFLRAE
jgi:hypothetical protein